MAPDSSSDLRRGITWLTDDEDYVVGDEGSGSGDEEGSGSGDEEWSGSGNEQGDESKELLDVIKGE